MLIDPATLRAIDRCIDMGIPFYAARTPDGNMHFGASTPEAPDTSRGEAFFIGAFNAPWRDSLRIPGVTPSSSAQAAPLPRPTDKEQYLASTAEVIAALKERGTAKTVISMVRRNPLPKAPISTFFARLAEHSDGNFAYLCYSPAIGCWMGAPPELLLKADADGHFDTMALAGTMPIDARDWDDKNAVEHQIVVEYIARELAACGIQPEIGERQSLAYGSIKHLYTPISGRLGECAAAKVYDALNPTPALCGYPKDAALADIAKAEKHRRDCYGGCVGLIEPDGSIQAYVNIRCCRIADGYAYCYGGGGITPDSVADDEWAEANTKIDNLLVRMQP